MLCATSSLAHGQSRKTSEPIAHVWLSTDFIQEMAQQAVTRTIDVNSSAAGTDIRGVGRLTGRTGLKLQAANDSAVFSLRVEGSVRANTVIANRAVAVRADSTIPFTATKKIRLGATGLDINPTQVTATSSSTIQGISSSLPGLRGRVAERVARSRQPQMEQAAARDAEKRIGQLLDDEVSQQLSNVLVLLKKSVDSLPLKSKKIRINYGARPDAFTMKIFLGTPLALAKVSDPPKPLAQPILVVHVRRAAIQETLGKLFEQILLGPGANRRLAAELNRLVSAEPALGTFEVRSTSNEHWLTLTVRRGPTPTQSAGK
jgi:hypothetical protein